MAAFSRLQIEQAAAALRAVDDLDRIIARILAKRARPLHDALGAAVRETFVKSQISVPAEADAEIGEVVAGVVLELVVERRKAAIAPFADLVTFPDLPAGDHPQAIAARALECSEDRPRIRRPLL